LSTAWTLCYEEQFYVVMGLLMLLGRPFFFSGVIVVTIVSCTLRLLKPVVPLQVDGVFLDGMWNLFAVGILVYHRVNHATILQRRCIDLCITVGIICSFLLMQMAGRPESVTACLDYLTVFLFAGLLTLLHPYDRTLTSWRVLAPLSFCGRLCYSLY